MKVAIYCRLSEEDKNKISKNDDSESIQNQKSMLINYAMQKNWEIYNIYSDDDYTETGRSLTNYYTMHPSISLILFYASHNPDSQENLKS